MAATNSLSDQMVMLSLNDSDPLEGTSASVDVLLGSELPSTPLRVDDDGFPEGTISPVTLTQLTELCERFDPEDKPTLRCDGTLSIPADHDNRLEWFWLPSTAKISHADNFRFRFLSPDTEENDAVFRSKYLSCHQYFNQDDHDFGQCNGDCRIVPDVSAYYDDVNFFAAGAFGAVASAKIKGTQDKVALKVIPRVWCRSYSADRRWRPIHLVRREVWCFLMVSVPEAADHFVQLQRVYEDRYWIILELEMMTGFNGAKKKPAGTSLDVLYDSFPNYLGQEADNKAYAAHLVDISKQAFGAVAWISNKNNFPPRKTPAGELPRLIVHRDIKPENFLFSVKPDGSYVIKLSDFGLSRDYCSTASLKSLVGSTPFQAPEILSLNYRGARPEYSLLDLTKCDVWSTGVMILQLAEQLRQLIGLPGGFTVTSENIIKQKDLRAALGFLRSKYLLNGFDDLLVSIFKVSTTERISAFQALHLLKKF